MILLASNGIGAIGYILYIAFAIFMLAAQWKIFEKAGYPGIACIIPIYNIYVLVKIAGYEGWMLVLLFVPLVNIIFAFMLIFKMADKFGKSGGFALGMIFLPFIFYPILGFDDSTYSG